MGCGYNSALYVSQFYFQDGFNSETRYGISHASVSGLISHESVVVIKRQGLLGLTHMFDFFL